ncbi:hypothetical protein MJO28_005850 [Puccinia striiformis f. sp. tritici]|uniref:Uncharacterized protein n=1 Tax=Puccinia striiformis f. sp. tritici TaxID=168172 RepID=A0ACC0EFQ5_9BASI|nr:hypothetical protein MJO28_005850 [Puccinia striiformis f. sp. tritici]
MKNRWLVFLFITTWEIRTGWSVKSIDLFPTSQIEDHESLRWKSHEMTPDHPTEPASPVRLDLSLSPSSSRSAFSAYSRESQPFFIPIFSAHHGNLNPITELDLMPGNPQPDPVLLRSSITTSPQREIDFLGEWVSNKRTLDSNEIPSDHNRWWTNEARPSSSSDHHSLQNSVPQLDLSLALDHHPGPSSKKQKVTSQVTGAMHGWGFPVMKAHHSDPGAQFDLGLALDDSRAAQKSTQSNFDQGPERTAMSGPDVSPTRDQANKPSHSPEPADQLDLSSSGVATKKRKITSSEPEAGSQTSMIPNQYEEPGGNSLSSGNQIDPPGLVASASSKQNQPISPPGAPEGEPEIRSETTAPLENDAPPTESSSLAAAVPSSSPEPQPRLKRTGQQFLARRRELSKVYQASKALLKLQERQAKKVAANKAKEKAAIENLSKKRKYKLVNQGPSDTIDTTKTAELKALLKSQGRELLRAKKVSAIKAKQKAGIENLSKKRKYKLVNQEPKDTTDTTSKLKGKAKMISTGKGGPVEGVQVKRGRGRPKLLEKKRLKVSPIQAYAEEEIKLAVHSPHTHKIWAWIFVATTVLMEERHQDLRFEQDTSTAQFALKLGSEIDQLIQKGHHHQEHYPEITKLELQENASNFAEFLFVIHLRLLQSWATKSSKVYIEEHESLEEWLLELLRKGPDHQAVDPIHEDTDPTVNFKDHPQQILDDVFESISSKKSDKLMYRVIKKHHFGDAFMGVTSESQLKMTKTIVTLLAAYYRSTNPKKWNALFTDGSIFLSHMAKLQTPHFHRNTKRIDTPKEFIEAMELLPWKEKLGKIDEKTLRSVRLSMRVSPNDKREEWVLPFQEEKPAVVDDEVWAAISLIDRGEREVIKADQLAITLAQDRYKPSLNPSLSPSLKSYVSNEDRLDRVEELVRLVWVLNSRLVEAFGYHTTDPEYIEEQNHLQDVLFGILNQPKNQEKVYRSSSKDKKTDSNNSNDDQEQEIGNLIFTGLRCKDIQAIIAPTYESDERVSRYEILMTESAVRLISHHYKQKNCMKWFNIFNNQDGFMLGFEKLAKRLRAKNSYHNFILNSFYPARRIQILPWKNNLFTTTNQKMLIIFLFRRNQYLV